MTDAIDTQLESLADDLADGLIEAAARRLQQAAPERREDVLTGLARWFAVELLRERPDMARDDALQAIDRFLQDVERHESELPPAGHA